MYTPRNRRGIFARFMAYIFNYTTRVLQWFGILSPPSITDTPSTHRETENDPQSSSTVEVTIQSPGNISCSSSDIEILQESDSEFLSDIEILSHESDLESDFEVVSECDVEVENEGSPSNSITNTALHPTQSNCRIM
ncbi:hypothetical protein [Ehrlichia muris]|uniref:Uncharacterized protein n=1 Tax=Ehrlichia muris AS145 TaxID=1423892 RepID=V9R8X4_9RICK|nr:hypothetical protein [Ehrlichia muris]AHC39753.1 hypothetical protein EMUR_03875 [Ehrlichia muris AS145]